MSKEFALTMLLREMKLKAEIFLILSLVKVN